MKLFISNANNSVITKSWKKYREIRVAKHFLLMGIFALFNLMGFISYNDLWSLCSTFTNPHVVHIYLPPLPFHPSSRSFRHSFRTLHRARFARWHNIFGHWLRCESKRAIFTIQFYENANKMFFIFLTPCESCKGPISIEIQCAHIANGKHKNQ